MSTVREVSWTDIPELARFEAEAFPDDAWTEASWWGELAGRPRRDYVAVERDGELAAYGGIDRGGQVADLMTLAVAPAHRGSGLGATLLDELEQRATTGGAEAMLLEVRADNGPARALYARTRLCRPQRAPRLLPAGRRRCSRHAQAVGGEGRRPMTQQPLVLGIETSCDETGVGIVRGETLLVDAVASSVDDHARFGGVVPEVASRAHLEEMGRDRTAWPRGRGGATASTRFGDLGTGIAGSIMVVGVGQGAGSRRHPLYREHSPRRTVASSSMGLCPSSAGMCVRGHRRCCAPDVTSASRIARPSRRGGEAFDKVPGTRLTPRGRTRREPVASDDRFLGPETGATWGHRFDFSFSGIKHRVALVQARGAGDR